MTLIEFFRPFTALAEGLRAGRRGVAQPGHFIEHEFAPVAGDAVATEGPARPVVLIALWERTLIAQTERERARLAMKWRAVKERLDGACVTAYHQLAPLVQQYAALHAAHVVRGLREPHGELADWARALLFVVAAGAELLFMKAALSVTRVPNIELYLLAVAPVAVLLGVTHIAGRVIRHWSHGGRENGGWFAMALGLAVIITSVAAVGALRAAYLEIMLKQQISTIIMIAMMAMNAIVSFGALVIAIGSTDADRELDRIVTEKRRIRRLMKAPWRRWTRAATAWDIARARYEEALAEIEQYAIARMSEWRYGVAQTLSGVVPPAFQERITRRHFIPRHLDFGPELDRPPASLNELLERYSPGQSTTPLPAPTNGNGRHPANAPGTHSNRTLPFVIPSIHPTPES